MPCRGENDVKCAIGGPVLAVLATLLSGCAVAMTGQPSAAEPALEVQAAAPAGADLAASCELPITFTLAPEWTAEPLDLDFADDPDADPAGVELLIQLMTRGPFTVACEADARATGELGFLRIFTSAGPGDDPRSGLEEFVAAENPRGQAAGTHEISDVEYTEFEVDGQPAAEVTYESFNETLELNDIGRAFAVDTPDGPVLVALDGLDAAQLLPAYELAKQTVRLT
jgi:hypothetical protein